MRCTFVVKLHGRIVLAYESSNIVSRTKEWDIAAYVVTSCRAAVTASSLRFFTNRIERGGSLRYLFANLVWFAIPRRGNRLVWQSLETP